MTEISVLGRRSGVIRALVFTGISEAGAKVGLALATLAVARALGPDRFGQWSYAMVMAGIVAIASEAGMSNATQKIIAAGRGAATSIVSVALGIRLAAVVTGLAVIGLYTAVVPQPAGVSVLLVMLGVFGVVTQFTLFLQGSFRATARPDLDAITRLAQQALLVGAVAACVVVGASAVAFAAAFAVTSIVSAVVVIAVLRGAIGNVWPRFDKRVCATVVREAWPFWLSGMFWVVYFRADVVTLSYLSSDRETGLYNLAYNAFQLLTLPGAMLMAALFPSLSHLHAYDGRSYARLRARAVSVAALLGALACVAALVVSGPGVQAALGQDYGGSTNALRVLAVALIFVYPNYVLMQALSAADGQRKMLAVVATGAILNVAMNIALVPPLGGLGAALATVVTEASVLVLLLTASRRATVAIEVPALEMAAA
jgi:O-antigen/teichoic acid export membrane protein